MTDTGGKYEFGFRCIKHHDVGSRQSSRAARLHNTPPCFSNPLAQISFVGLGTIMFMHERYCCSGSLSYCETSGKLKVMQQQQKRET